MLIDILLSTYNGSDYVEQQIQSILRQSRQDWRLLIRDDGSSDGMLDLLHGFCDRHPGRIEVINGQNIGVAQSFSELLKLSKAPYVMFCDQDDMWFDDKIEVMLQSIESVEKRRGTRTPVLAFSNLSLVDQAGRPMGIDFWSFHGINPYHSSLNRLLLQNVVTGCACMFNRALLDVSVPIPKAAILHDWWLALNATLFGELMVVERPTIYYRQHSANQVGARGVNYTRLRQMMGAGGSVRGRLAGIMQRTAAQASALLSMHDEALSQKQKRLLEGYASLPDMTAVNRKIFLLREKVFFTSNIRNVCLMLL